jgi:tetratricopeptide (TPR) repeat protein
MAPSLVQSYLESGQGDNALAACQWLNSADGLRTALHAVQVTFQGNERKAHGGYSVRQLLWNKHWENQLHRLGSSLDHAGERLDDALLYTLKLEALLEGDEALKGSYLARAIIESGSMFGPQLRARAYASAIRAHHQLKNWEEARVLADAFIGQYPDDPAIPDILMLNARTAAGQKQYGPALQQIQQLLDNWPKHTSRRSWLLLKGQWLLDSGNGQQALQIFTSLEVEAIASWIPFLQFHKGRCLNSLRQVEDAIATFTSVSKHPQATPVLVELSMTELLKVYLKQLDTTNFLETLAAYRRDYPQGWNHPVVENLAGSFHAAIGEVEKAARRYLEVAALDHPAASYAHGQLSQLYRKFRDMDNLRSHALAWIRQAGKGSGPLPEIPFLDCQMYQDATGKAALGQADLQSLLEAIDAGSAQVPASAALKVLASLWDTYHQRLPDAPPEILSWCETRGKSHFQENRIAGFAAYQLFAADLLEAEGRVDSADARRIRILQAGNTESLPEASLLVVSRTADRYDFPEARFLLESYLETYPDSRARPEVLYLLALRLSKTDDPEKAFGFLREIHSEWPDSSVQVPAGLTLAKWLVRDGHFTEAHRVAGSLLEVASLKPGDAAAALLLRARADFHMQQFDRAALSCARILNLYPDFHDIADTARNLLHEHEDNITHPEQKAFIQSLGHYPAGLLDYRSLSGHDPRTLGQVPFRNGFPWPAGQSGGKNAFSPVG